MSSGYCKICCLEFNSNVPAHPLIDNTDNQLTNVGQMFIQCIFREIKPTNGFFDRLCTECTSKLLDFYKFRCQAIDTNNKYAELFHNGNGIIEEIVVDLDENEQDFKNEDSEIDVTTTEHSDFDTKLQFEYDEMIDSKDNVSFSYIEIEPIEMGDSDEGIDGQSENERNDSDVTVNSPSINDIDSIESNPPPLQRKKKIRYFINRSCELCNVNFKTLKELNIHNKTLHTQCEYCDRKFTSPWYLKAHINAFHLARLTCNTCGYVGKTKYQLLLHETRHGTERPYACEHCDHRCYTKFDMKLHLRMHTGERPYVCELCGSSFRYRSHMRQHAQNHKGRTFKCVDCDRKYVLRQSLKHHREKHHLFRNLWKCSLCGKLVHKAKKLNHVKCHSKSGEIVTMIQVNEPVPSRLLRKK